MVLKTKIQFLLITEGAELHQKLNLRPGLSLKLKSLSSTQNAWLNLMLMCAVIGSPGTIAEVFRGYWGERKAIALAVTRSKKLEIPYPDWESFNISTQEL
jgi:hypothetical protein